jgi:hypothetical protein
MAAMHLCAPCNGTDPLAGHVDDNSKQHHTAVDSHAVHGSCVALCTPHFRPRCSAAGLPKRVVVRCQQEKLTLQLLCQHSCMLLRLAMLAIATALHAPTSMHVCWFNNSQFQSSLAPQLSICPYLQVSRRPLGWRTCDSVLARSSVSFLHMTQQTIHDSNTVLTAQMFAAGAHIRL